MTSPVWGIEEVGGLVGFNNGGSVIASFWDAEVPDRTINDAGIAKTTAEMQTAATFIGAGWDFMEETQNGTEDIWWIVDGQDYPRLSWERAKQP